MDNYSLTIKNDSDLNNLFAVEPTSNWVSLTRATILPGFWQEVCPCSVCLEEPTAYVITPAVTPPALEI